MKFFSDVVLLNILLDIWGLCQRIGLYSIKGKGYGDVQYEMFCTDLSSQIFNSYNNEKVLYVYPKLKPNSDRTKIKKIKKK